MPPTLCSLRNTSPFRLHRRADYFFTGRFYPAWEPQSWVEAESTMWFGVESTWLPITGFSGGILWDVALQEPKSFAIVSRRHPLATRR